MNACYTEQISYTYKQWLVILVKERKWNRYWHLPGAAVVISWNNLVSFTCSKRIKIRKHESLGQKYNLTPDEKYLGHYSKGRDLAVTGHFSGRYYAVLSRYEPRQGDWMSENENIKWLGFLPAVYSEWDTTSLSFYCHCHHFHALICHGLDLGAGQKDHGLPGWECFIGRP